MEKLFANISRNFYLIPGAYYLAIFLMKLFSLLDSDNTWRTYTFKGITFKVDISTYLGRLLYWRGAHEWAPIMALRNIIKNGFTCIDIGANQGEYTLWMAKLAGANGQVISFEPLTKMFKQLSENIALNKSMANRIIPIKKGLSDKESELPIYSVNADSKYADNEGMPSLFPTSSKNTFVENILLSTLDIELNKLNIQKVDFIKVDVEGAELSVLKGAFNTLSKFKPILLIEFNEATFKAAGYTSIDIFNFLNQFGYKFYLIGTRGNISKCNIDRIPEFCNILAKV